MMTNLDHDDYMIALAESLDSSPGKNWVEDAGGLPEYIRTVAKDIKDSGKSTSSAIAIAVSRVKKWCATSKDAGVRAKACAAVAEWEKLKAKAKADNVKATSDSPLEMVVRLADKPCCLSEVVELAAKKPYGDVKYADPGYKDGKARYPINNESHVRAAWSYINMPKNQKGYTPAQVAAIKNRIKAAAKKFGIEIED